MEKKEKSIWSHVVLTLLVFSLGFGSPSLRCEDLNRTLKLRQKIIGLILINGLELSYDQMEIILQSAEESKRLREEFQKSIHSLSDDMEMGAVAPLDLDGNGAVQAVMAGCDLVLYCSELDRAERAATRLDVRACNDPEFAGRLERARQTVRRAAQRWPAAEGELQAGNVVTAEPGLYYSGRGGVRIEDVVLVTKGGCRMLSSLGKELDTVVV